MGDTSRWKSCLDAILAFVSKIFQLVYQNVSYWVIHQIVCTTNWNFESEIDNVIELLACVF